MTGRDRNELRDLVDREVRDRETQRREASRLMREIVPRRRRRPIALGRCIYCGWLCRGRACSQHRDLIQIETAAVA